MKEIFERTSVRKFTDEMIHDHEIQKLLEAAMCAPSAGNQQPWEFYVVTDHDYLRRLSKCSEYAKPIEEAPCGIVACMNSKEARFPQMMQQDLAAAVENILLEATGLGLGAVWLGVAPDEPRMQKIAEVLDAPENIQPFAMIAVGHPAETHTPRSANNYDPDKVHWISYIEPEHNA